MTLVTDTTPLVTSIREIARKPVKPTKDADPEVLLAEDVAPILRREIDRVNREMKGDNPDGIEQGALDLIERVTGIHPRCVSRILTQESAVIDLTIVDSILLGLDVIFSLVIPEEIVYRRSAVHGAARTQTEMLESMCRARGEWVPPVGTSKERRSWAQVRRRRYFQHEAAAA